MLTIVKNITLNVYEKQIQKLPPTLGYTCEYEYPPFCEHRSRYPKKPFIESKSIYEDVLTLESNGRRRATPYILRRVAYLALQNGACGL